MITIKLSEYEAKKDRLEKLRANIDRQPEDDKEMEELQTELNLAKVEYPTSGQTEEQVIEEKPAKKSKKKVKK